MESILEIIPRGGGNGHDLESKKTFAGLVNLGNTCYLNAQLQCAYHVPYLRQLIKDARDSVVEVEVEVEVEVDVEVEVEVNDDEDMEGGVKWLMRSKHWNVTMLKMKKQELEENHICHPVISNLYYW